MLCMCVQVEAEGGAASSSPALPLCPAGRPDADVQPLLTEGKSSQLLLK